MTIADERVDAPVDEPVDAPPGPDGERETEPPPPPPGDGGDEEVAEEPGTPVEPEPDGADERPTAAELIRPVLAAALATAAAGLVAGGIFGSWGARLTGLAGAFGGAAWAFACLRSRRPSLMQGLFPVAAVVAGAAALGLRGESPGALPDLIGDAVSSGRLFRPPVPYDPGWTPILLVLMATIGFAAAWVATALDRPRLAVAVPLPVVALTAITQPDDGQFIAGLAAFLPVLAALAVLFGGDTERAAALDRQFELKRTLRGIAAAVPVVLLLVALNRTSFLFPEPVYDPTERPQKPKAVPLSAALDRVLFVVRTDSNITGPWRTGALDVYDSGDGFWKAPPRQLERLPADGALSELRAGVDQLAVSIVVHDLGDSPTFPTLAGVTRVEFAGDPPGDARYDTRTDVIRMESGRVPAGASYTLHLPSYPTATQLAEAAPGERRRFDAQLEIPSPPTAVRQLLAEAPPEPWRRLDFLRDRLLDNVVAAGAGTPVEIEPQRVAELFREDAEATPYEIVAAEAMLARWAGVPSRIGFGFDGLNEEGNQLTVRPRNSAQWLEVWFDGYGWTPLIGAPKQAESALDSDPARFNPTIEASDDVAVDLYLPFERESLEQLYERIRRQLLLWSPVVAALAVSYVAWPYFAKLRRRAKRRRWAIAHGPRAQIAVEYVEVRDLAIDLNVGDMWSTPLEYLYEIKDDDEHTELAWLVSRAVYGDLKDRVGEADVRAAGAMSASIRRRLLRAQPVQSQLLALISRASLRQPYSREVPNVAPLRIPRPRLPRPRLPRLRLRAATGGGPR